MEAIDKKKRDSDDIKLEDYKPDPPVIDTSTLIDDESSTEDRDIKQEATKNHDSLPQQMDIFEGKDYYYLCDLCKERMPNLLTVIKHRKSVHKVKPYNTSMVKNFDSEPDIHDPNFYCKPCEVHYSSRNTYRSHLRKAHFMILKTLPKRKKPQNTIVPDPDDPNHYCRACDYVYATKLKYKYHCRYAHGMTSIELGNQGYLANGIVDTHCKICDMRLASKTTYKSHLFTIHKLDWRQIHEEPRDILPDIRDPNNYCNYIPYINQRPRKPAWNQMLTIPTITAVLVKGNTAVTPDIERIFVLYIR
ncbi:hypothetical protein HMPREF1544_06002 [Mucor circinelloides 1006PhL]|uniref:C2H2-type domain-containing protein n=1 Tax=Mucor circinelloides f. circinelloides (strain 1006PhL) TaxID=1220926 RepID=S2JFB5_MUCC1|nr:hypothetical protein HMPREF1544_06002 [Mucor circinelloides 1006PhL]